MILQALVRHYEDLSARGEIAPPGWGTVNVSYALELNEAGDLVRAVCVKTEQPSGKKTALLPQAVDDLPAPVKRTVGVEPNFLCDHSGYILGVDNKGKPQRSLECFAACKALHEELLAGIETSAAQALLAFFQNWKPEQAMNHPAFQDIWEDITSGGNLLFRYDGEFIHRDEAIKAAWQAHYNAVGEGAEMVCLVTGERGPAEAVHPAIKKVQGAQSSGAALVSFNAPAFCSYGKEQNLNAPVGKYAAFAYTSALNHLLADREHVCRVGDNTTVVCWAEGGERAYQGLFAGYFFGAPVKYTERELREKTARLLDGKPVELDEEKLDPDKLFYILGLSPNAARLSVRFFLRSSFGQFLKNVQAHYDRLEITPASDKTLSPWRLLGETVNQNSQDKSPAPNLAGAVLQAILNDTPYPATLLNGVTLRIRAERKITRNRAAVLKAYYLKHPHPDVPKEVLQVSLNPDRTSVPYALGRLFSVLEDIQSAANPGINATIKDKYFNSASATPAVVFPTLVNLAQKHLRKLDQGLRIYQEKRLTELLGILGEEYPTRMNLPQQGAFQLGYYHQTQKRYEKKEEN